MTPLPSTPSLKASKYFVTSYDGAKLYVEEAGNPEGTPIIFIHGFAQSKNAWKNQMGSPELRECRLIAYDLRGHGNSDKPRVDYSTKELWAKDLNAIIETLDLKNSILVGWSYGGLIILDYIRFFGLNSILGLNLVGGCTMYELPLETVLNYGEEIFTLDNLASEDPTIENRSMSLFTRLFTKDPIPDIDFRNWISQSMQTPTWVKKGMMERCYNNDDLLPKITTPVLATYGKDDRVVPYQSQSLGLFPNCQIELFDDTGHAVFYEKSNTYNRILSNFVNSCSPSSG